MKDTDSSLNLKPIKGYEGRYSISDCGKIFTYYYKKPTRRKTTITHNGYERVSLMKNYKAKSYPVHRLVLSNFSELPDDMEVNHIDGDKLNNHIDNLEAVTPQRNKVHSNSVLYGKPRGIGKSGRGYKVELRAFEKKIYLGTYLTKEEAYNVFYDTYLEWNGVEPWKK